MAKRHTNPADTKADAKPHTSRAASGSDAFVRAVEAALDHFADAAWLGEHSSLAAPYFLGNVLDRLPEAEKAAQRGRALQQVLQDAAAQLPDDQRTLLRITYFQISGVKRGSRLDNPGIALALHLSERSYYRYRTKTIEDLAEVLSRSLMPSLRPELPLAQHLVGRESWVAQVVQALTQGQSVGITGESGIGKTALAAAVAQAWQKKFTPANAPSVVFWHTVRAALNDRLHGLLFPLAYFLRLQGAIHTWRQLVADNGLLEISRIMGLLRFDLATLKTQSPQPISVLLCIDEVDTLQPDRSDHAQVLHVLEELVALVPVCLIGQHPVLRMAHHIALTGLDAEQTTALFVEAGLNPLAADEHERLQQVAHGNPAMLKLLMTLHSRP